MESGHSLSVDDYHLDYTQLLLPTVLIGSLRRKHCTVFFTTLASVILKVQIVLSPGLFELSAVQGTEPVTLNVMDSFDIADNITDSSLLSYYFARSLQNFDLEPPFGVNARCAYQTFSWPGKTGQEARGIVNSPLKAIVDAIFANMTCLHLESHETSWGIRNDSYGVEVQETDIELRFEDCDETVVVHESTRISQQNTAPRADKRVVSRTVVDNLFSRPCSSLPQQQPQLVYYSGACNPGASEDELSPPLEECAAVLCSPMTWVSKVEVIDDGNEQNVSLHENQDGYPVDVRTNLWDMLLHSIPGDYKGARPPVDAAFAFRGLDIDEEGFLATNDGLEQALVNLTNSLAPMVAHHALRRTGETQMDGSWIVKAMRLQMNRAVCFAMMSLFAICACIALGTLLRSRRVLRAWHRDPATVLGTMLFFHSDSPASVSCRNTLSDTRERDEALWSGSGFTPFVLRPWLRIIVVLYMLGLITALAVTLRISQTSDRIATINEERYSSLLWTSVPTLAVLLVAMFVSSSDAALRGLITLASMSEKPCHAWQLDLCLLDMLGLHSLYLSLKMRLPAIGLTQGLAMLCGFLAALSSTLFTADFSGELTETQFEQSSWFGGSNPRYNSNEDVWGKVVGAIGLTSGTGNLTYPPGTYADLLFPSLVPRDDALRDLKSIYVEIPAARMNHACVELTDGTDITVDIVAATRQGDNQKVRFVEQMDCPPEARSDAVYTLADVTHEHPYFGLVLKYHLCETGPGAGGRRAVDTGEDGLWWTRSYAWGKVSGSGNGSLAMDYFSAWRCNFTWAAVDTTLSHVPMSDVFRIDHHYPPYTDESTMRPYDPLFPVPVFIQDFQKAELHKTLFPPGINTDPRVQGFSDQIALLMEPVGSLGFQDLESKERRDFVLETINANTRLAMAQIANFEHRLGTNETSQTKPFEHGELSIVSGVVNRQPPGRLVQNTTVTYILISILSAVVLVNTWALLSYALLRYGEPGGIDRWWLLDLELACVASDGYRSVAMMGALVSGSNYHDSMPDNAHLMSPDQLVRHLADRRFQMGWFDNSAATSKKVFTIGVVEDEGNSHFDVERETINPVKCRIVCSQRLIMAPGQ